MANDGKITSLTAIPAIDPANDVLEIVDVSANASYKVTPQGLFNLTSNAVSLADVQTLTNKTLTAPTLTSPIFNGTITGTYTLAGSPTFPSSVVTLTGSQTLTNKTLTSPILTTPTLTNASITQDSVVGFTSANNGTIYGVSVVNGALGTNALASNAVQASQLATNAIFLGSASITTNFTGTATSVTLITGLSVTVTVPAGSRNLKVTFVGSCSASAVGGNQFSIQIWDNTLSAEKGVNVISIPTASYTCNGTFVAFISAPSAGTHVYQARYNQTAAGTFTCNATATSPAFILVEAI